MQSDGVLWMYEWKCLDRIPLPLCELGTARYQKAEWKVNVYSNRIFLRKLSGKCESHVRFWRSTETWVSRERGYRISLGIPSPQGHGSIHPPLFQYTRGPAQVARHRVTYDMSNRQTLLTLGYWRWHISARCSPVTTPSLAARRWSRSPTMVAIRRTQSN